MTTTTQEPGTGLPVASVPGATDPPDPESHQPPLHLDSSEEVSALDDGDLDSDGTMPTEGADGKPAGIAEGQDEEGDLGKISNPWDDSVTGAAADAAIAKQEEYLHALATAEERCPNADLSDREAWARAVVDLPQGVGADGQKLYLTKDGLDALVAKLDATNAERSTDPDESFDADVMHALADELSEEAESRRSELDEPKQGTARVIPKDGESFRIDERFARAAGEILRLPISESIIYPMEFRSAERILRGIFSEMSENHRRICAYALAGYTSYPLEGESARVDIDLTHIEAWVAEVLEDRRRRAELEEVIQSAAERAIEDRLPRAVRRFTARLETPWYKSPEGIAAIGAVALVILFFITFVVKEERSLSRIEARRDAAAEEIGTVYNKDGKLVEVNTFEELAAATGFPEDPAAREVRTIAQVASLDARVKVIEDKRAELNKERDDAVAQAALEGDKRVRTETAFDALQELRREEQNDHAMRLGELERSLSRAERLLGVATSDVEAARVFYKDHVRAGRCGNPLDEDYPQDAGGLRAHYQCDFGRVVCAGRLPSEANNCRRVKR